MAVEEKTQPIKSIRKSELIQFKRLRKFFKSALKHLAPWNRAYDQSGADWHDRSTTR